MTLIRGVRLLQMPPSTLGKSLSDPDVPAGNNGFDNANCDLIMHVNDVLLGAENNRYSSPYRITVLMQHYLVYMHCGIEPCGKQYAVSHECT